MAHIDLTKIEGYADMSAEDKLKALEGYELPEPDHTGYVTKQQFDTLASELAAKKRELAARLSNEEIAAQQEREERERMQQELDALRRESAVAKHKAKFIGMGYDEALAEDTAAALADGTVDKVLANLKKHLYAFETRIRADTLKDTPKPTGGGSGRTMTLDAFRKLPDRERADYAANHPEEYKELYGGNE